MRAGSTGLCPTGRSCGALPGSDLRPSVPEDSIKVPTSESFGSVYVHDGATSFGLFLSLRGGGQGVTSCVQHPLLVPSRALLNARPPATHPPPAPPATLFISRD